MTVLRAADHGAELVEVERLSVLADALLPEEDRAGRIELYENRDDRDHGKKEGEEEKGDGDIRSPLQRIVDPVLAGHLEFDDARSRFLAVDRFLQFRGSSHCCLHNHKKPGR